MLSYSHGSWFAVASPAGAALLAPEVAVDAVRAAWVEMAAADSLESVLDGVVGSFGTSLRSLPSFGVIAWDAATGSARVLVRGPVSVVVTSASGEIERFSGERVATWSERTIDDAASVTLVVVSADEVLPLRDGIVRAGALTWMLSAPTEIAHLADVAMTLAPRSPATPVPPPAAPELLSPPPLPPLVFVAAVPPVPQPDPVAAAAPGAGYDETLAPDPGLSYALAPVPESAPAPSPGASPDLTVGYDDFLYGETRMSSVEDAAVRVASDDEPVAPALISGIPARALAPVPDAGDHDGETISGERFAELQALLAESGGTAPVLGGAASDRRAPMLVVSTGERVVLDRGVIIGRRPKAERAAGVVPHLVTVPSPNQDVSRSHIELRARGGDILAIDLGATNGTRLLRTGADPIRLHPGEPTLLVDGDRLDLGEGIVLEFEGLG